MSVLRSATRLLPFSCRRNAAAQSVLLNDCFQKRGTKSDSIKFPGAQAPFVLKPALKLASEVEQVPIYRVIDSDGLILDQSQDPKLSREIVQKMFRDIITLSTMDKILYESQRQGRISFYMTNSGEEASHIGSAAGLSDDDLVYAQYREAGVLLWRGFTVADFINQCYGNDNDMTRGRQMPVHYGSKKFNFVTISSPLGTQMPQAVGAAYAIKLKPNNQRIVICYFGEGAASEGDAHAAFNFAATLDCPIVMFCRNNGYAISTPTKEQYKGDGIAGRAAGYGMAAIRVDGTDVFAVYNATKLAREYALKNNQPVVIEAMSYRLGHHSTSDDSSAYRSLADLELWNTTEHPTYKLKNYMKLNGWWNEEEEAAFAKSARDAVLKQMVASEKTLKPNWREMFNDVYKEMTPILKSQRAEMEAHVAKHKEHYPLENFKQ